MSDERRPRLDLADLDADDRRRTHSHVAERPAMLQRHELPRTLEEAEERYVAARNGWTAAMQRAASGRPADLAALAIAQQAYEAALVERNRWRAGERVAVKVEPASRGLDAVIGQELAWRRVHAAEQHKQPGFFARLARRLGGRSRD